MGSYFPEPNMTTIAIAAGLLVMIAIMFVIWYVLKSMIVKIAKICFRIALAMLLTAIFLSVAYIVAGWALWAHLDDRYGKITPGMTISEVREIMSGTFEESDVALTQMAGDGYLPDGDADAEDRTLYAKKYSCRLWRRLRIYVIYGVGDTVKRKIDDYK